MKGAAPTFLSALALLSGVASAQGANDPAAPLRACLPMESADRLECLDKPSRATSPPLRLALAGDGWVVSETTSPIDYSPIATATTASRNLAGGAPMELSIRCRGGRTELALTGPAIKGRGDNYFISYRVNGGQPVQLAGATAAFGGGVAFKGDVVALLQQLPDEGELVVRLMPLSGNELERIFSLNGLETLRTRIGATCKWPHVIAKPADR
jgi:hypothetical protein